jgi:hypothetical protein
MPGCPGKCDSSEVSGVDEKDRQIQRKIAIKGRFEGKRWVRVAS